MRSERNVDFDGGGGVLTASCPACRKAVTLRREAVALHQLLRCPHCDGHLQVAGLSPMNLRVFKTYGLALVDD